MSSVNLFIKRASRMIRTLVTDLKAIVDRVEDIEARQRASEVNRQALPIVPGSTLGELSEVRWFRVTAVDSSESDPHATGRLQELGGSGDALIDDPDDATEYRLTLVHDSPLPIVDELVPASLEGLRDDDEAVYKVLSAVRLGVVFAVDLAQTGGSAGNKTTQCSFTYSVTDLGGNTLATGVNPISSPHRCARTSVGKLVAATKGTACYLVDSDAVTLALCTTNEVFDVSAC